MQKQLLQRFQFLNPKSRKQLQTGIKQEVFGDAIYKVGSPNTAYLV